MYRERGREKATILDLLLHLLYAVVLQLQELHLGALLGPRGERERERDVYV